MKTSLPRTWAARASTSDSSPRVTGATRRNPSSSAFACCSRSSILNPSARAAAPSRKWKRKPGDCWSDRAAPEPTPGRSATTPAATRSRSPMQTSPVFSAFGAAAADVIRTRVMSCQYILPADPAVINQRLDAIEEEMGAALTGEGFKRNLVEFRRFFTMRYRRQTAGVEMLVAWDRFTVKRVAEIQTAFEKKYEELYGVGAGYPKAGSEISEIRVDAVGKVAKPRLST